MCKNPVGDGANRTLSMGNFSITAFELRPTAERLTTLYNDHMRAVKREKTGESPRSRSVKLRMSEAFGLWKNREDLRDVNAYVRRLRQPGNANRRSPLAS